MGWFFGFEAFLSLPFYVWGLLHPFPRQSTTRPSRDLFLAVLFSAFIIVFAVLV